MGNIIPTKGIHLVIIPQERPNRSHRDQIDQTDQIDQIDQTDQTEISEYLFESHRNHSSYNSSFPVSDFVFFAFSFMKATMASLVLSPS